MVAAHHQADCRRRLTILLVKQVVVERPGAVRPRLRPGGGPCGAQRRAATPAPKHAHLRVRVTSGVETGYVSH